MHISTIINNNNKHICIALLLFVFARFIVKLTCFDIVSGPMIDIMLSDKCSNLCLLPAPLSAVEASLGRIRSCQAQWFGPRSRKKLAADSN